MDYGARVYDNANMQRWLTMDPLAELNYGQSPYAFSSNNPVNRIDPDGRMDVETKYFDEEGRFLAETNDNYSDRIVVVPGQQLRGFQQHLDLTDEGIMNSDGWNNHWASEFGEYTMTSNEKAVVDMYHSESARNNAIGYMINPSMANFGRMVGSEMLAQWTTPELVVGGLSVWAAGIPRINSGSIAPKNVGPASGYTRHGLNQAISRDLGRGVHPSAIHDAITKPIRTVPQSGGRTMYIGNDATVVLNQNGKIITTYGKPRNP